MNLLTELIEHFGMSHRDLTTIIATAPARYKVYQIPKRRGGTRTIAQPSRELKAIQRYILDTKLDDFPVHCAATGYVRGKGIRNNAEQHKSGHIFLKLDFQHFFPSIKVRDWQLLCRANHAGAISGDDVAIYSQLLFWGEVRKSTVPRCLSIGAPTSPMMSNIVMFDIDSRLAAAADELNVVYTRYADDITVSGEDVEAIRRFETIVRRVLQRSRSPRLTLNGEKRGLYLPGHRRMVTGLIITPTQQISIGRARKREIAALIHRSSLGQLDEEQRAYLKGMLGFCLANEPEFVGRMRRKYGDAPIDTALTFHAPRQRIEILDF